MRSSSTVAAFVVAALAGLLLTGCSDDSKPNQPTPPEPTTSDAATPAPSTSASQTQPEAAPETQQVPEQLMPKEAASVTFESKSGSKVSGSLRVEQRDDGVWFTGDVAGLTPGGHGIHIHENGDCSAPDGSSAGKHYAPASKTHGAPTDAEHHAGDMGNIEADADGTATIAVLAKDVTLSGNQGIINRAIIIHASADDMTTQPSGNSGSPVACGVITAG